MKTRMVFTILAVSAIAGVAYNDATRKPEPSACCAATGVPMLMADAGAAAKPAPIKPAKPAPKAQHKIVAYYFHGNYRCASCRKLEAWTSETVRKDFAKDLQSGRLEWRVVNVETKGNEHYMRDYKLYTKSVVLSDTAGAKETRWKNLDKVWNLLGNEASFKAYVRGEVSAYLKGT